MGRYEFDWVGPLTNDNGLITGREINHKTGETRPSFDIFDAADWPGGIEDGKRIARMLEYTHNAFHGHEKKVTK